MDEPPSPPEQGELFPDPLVGSGFDGLPDQLVGFRGPTACQVVGITYRQLDYWARTGLVVPSIRGAAGSGSQRLYSFKDMLVLKVVKRLLDAGVSLQNIRVAVEHLRRRGVRDLAASRCSPTAPRCTSAASPEEVVDLLQGGQGVFGIAVSRRDEGDQRLDQGLPGGAGRRRHRGRGPRGRAVRRRRDGRSARIGRWRARIRASRSARLHR